jgi:Tripartite tricarboxylate transporter TctB family
VSAAPASRAGAPATRRTRSIEAIVFDLFLVAFVGLIVWTASGINPRAALVPLVIGIPTLVGLLITLGRDVVGAPERTAGTRPLDAGALRESSVDDTLALAAEELEADSALPDDPAARRAQAALAIWAFGFVALAIATSFLVAVPVGLVVILGWTTRRLLPTIAITVAASAFLYLVFVVLLDVPF